MFRRRVMRAGTEGAPSFYGDMTHSRVVSVTRPPGRHHRPGTGVFPSEPGCGSAKNSLFIQQATSVTSRVICLMIIGGRNWGEIWRLSQNSSWLEPKAQRVFNKRACKETIFNGRCHGGLVPTCQWSDNVENSGK